MSGVTGARGRPDPNADTGAVLDIAGLTVSFPGVGEVLRGVDLRLEPGRCLAVVGESGAGKSVLARTLVGLAGEGGAPAAVAAERFTVAGQDVNGAGARQWRRLRGAKVGFVLQDALQSLDPLRTVGAEVGESLQLRRRGRPERSGRVLQALAHAGLDEPETRAAQRSGELSGGMRQRALIASAIVAGPQLLVADEPTTALDATVARGVLELLGRLRDEGTAVLLVTHDLGAVARLADDVMVLDGGRVVESGPTGQVLSQPDHPVTRALVAAVPRGPSRRPPVPETAPDVLRATGLHRRYPLPGGGTVNALDGVDLTVRRGQALGVVGESGSGKSTLARVLVAAERADAGRVELAGEPWSELPERNRRPRRHLVRMIPQDPLGSFDPRWNGGRILRTALKISGSARTPAELLELVRLPDSVQDRSPRALSGGQRQRLAIARALAAEPAVLVLDEPVSALDVTVQAAILQMLTELQERTGTALVLISHDLAVIRKTCDSVAVMHRGSIVERGPVEQVWSHPQAPFTRALLEARPPLPAFGR
ncbi:ABC transporter ATP-binding protein [Citricoccus nitrophenolicus]|uniref:ABC transporter ATP-binding protein n=1 Tax=Citricoccus nitrophenolicus TaxID=863575 RepID=UPI0031F1198B